MADFSRLPNEMISQIWGNIQEPEDVESFALVSKHVYAIGRPFVEEHNKLKREFAFIEIDPEMDVIAPASLLKEVLYRPRVALYVTHLSVGQFRCQWDNPGNDGDERPKNAHVPYPDDVMALFIETIQQSSFVPRTESSRWITSVEAGHEDPIFALLLMLLPNLVMVTVKDDGQNAHNSQETILRIAEAEKTLFLTHLVTVHTVCRFYEGRSLFSWLRMFAALPSVQSIHFDGMSVAEVHDAIDDEHYFVSESYSIRELTFTNSSIHPRFLAQLLDSIEGLKVFSYVDLHVRFREFNPFWIRTALLANAKHSLEYLKIRSAEFDQVIGTLRGFTALTDLETNSQLLCDRFDIHIFVYRLPSSIEKIHLHTSLHEGLDIVSSLVEEIVKAKSRLIPRLKALKFTMDLVSRTIQKGRSMIEALEEKCQNAGIELTFVDY